MGDLPNTLLSVLQQSRSAKDLASILKSKQLGHVIFEELIRLWKSGRLFVSNITRDTAGYIPDQSALWAIAPIDGYYGYDPNSGVFRIATTGYRPTQLRLAATIQVGQSLLSLAVAPNGEDFVIGGHDGSIWVGNISNASVSKEMAAHDKRVWGVDYSPDGHHFLSCSEDGKLLLWDRDTGQCLQIAELDDSITDVRFSPDGLFALTTQKVDEETDHPTLRLWSLKDKITTASFFHHAKNAYAVSYLPNGKGFLSSGSDQTVALWSFEEERKVFQNEDHKATVNCCDVSPDSKLGATGAWNGMIRLWDLETGKSTAIEAHNARVLSVKFSRTGNLLASGSKDSQLAIWHMPEGSLTAMQTAHSGWVRDAAFAGNDNVIISVGTEGLCKIWSVE